MTYVVGIIGCGRIANTIDDELQGPRRGGIVLPLGHVGGYKLVEETEVVAACDVVEDKLDTFCERWDVPRKYTDFRELNRRGTARYSQHHNPSRATRRGDGLRCRARR